MAEFKSDADDSGNGGFNFLKKAWRSTSGVSRALPGTVTTKVSSSSSSEYSGPLSSLIPPSIMKGVSSISLSAGGLSPIKTPSRDAESSISTSASPRPRPPPASSERQDRTKPYRITHFEQLLQAENVDINALRKLAWNGIPADFRPMVWQLLLGYLPTNKGRRDQAIARKRKEYIESIPMYCDVPESDRSAQESETLRQILKDLPRTSPDTPFFHQPGVQKAMERILYIWSIRHPASGYVQGIDDLLTPMLLVCMHPFVEDVLRCDVEAEVDEQTMLNMEADSFWCLTKLLDNIQDHYTSSQPGLQRMVLRLQDLINRIENELHQHFVSEGLEYIQFSFRWMNCLLLREVPLRAVLRLWDTYLSEDRGGFENFHVYVCAVLLKTFRDRLLTMQFQDIIMFLQELPTTEWGEEDVEPILSQAFILSTLFEDSPSHLN